MPIRIRSLAAAAAAALAGAFLATASAQTPTAIDETPESLPDFPGRDETFGYCVGCHSFKVVGRQGMDRGRWDDTLSWMTEKHAMPAPDAEMRKVLIDYLAQAYPIKAPSQAGGWVSPFAPKP
ncbi:MAG TPA: hypothetical protein VIU82_16375 [Bosea sp. (in: a-proteobacteria)]|jgi:hypothetical protein